MERFDVEKHVFVENMNKAKSIFGKDWSLPNKAPEVLELDGGIVLPLRKRENVQVSNEAYEGGVCDKDGNFVAGNRRKLEKEICNLSCARAYPIPERVNERHETVIFGGILYWHWGDNWNEYLPARLWYLGEHPDTPYKFVFLSSLYKGGFTMYNVLEAIGIPRERMEIITEPTRFDKIIVPEESVYNFSGYRPQMIRFYDYVRSLVQPGAYKKIYLSRRAYEDQDVVNEEYYEEFFKRRGYHVVYPEKLPILEQISLMAGAEEVACTYGTISILTYFCRPHTRVTVLNRCRGMSIYTVYMRLLARELDLYVVDACLDFLPTTELGRSIYFFGPTVYWKRYLDSAGIAYDPDEVSFDLHVRPKIYDYLAQWAKNYSMSERYWLIRNTSLIDVVDSMNRVFFQQPVERKLMPERDLITKLKTDLAEQKTQTMAAQFKAEIQQTADSALRDRVDDILANNSDLRRQIDDLRQDNRELRASNQDLMCRLRELETALCQCGV